MEKKQTKSWVVAVHGGVGPAPKKKTKVEQMKTALTNACISAGNLLNSGKLAEECAVSAVVTLEDSGMFNAGIGTNLTEKNTVENDTALMSTKTGRYSSLSLLQNLKNPSLAALALYDEIGKGRPYPTMLGGDPAMSFCRSQKIVELPLTAFKHYHPHKESAKKYDTVGCVCFDLEGTAAVCTSSGGPKRKPQGRIGSAAIYGAGFAAETYEDSTTACAVSGNGDYLMRNVIALQWCQHMDKSEVDFTEKVVKSPDKGTVYPPVFGIIALTRMKDTDYTELYYGQAAPSFSVAYYSPSMKKPKVKVSTLFTTPFMSESTKLY